jgi:hypothetical protein
MRRQHPDLREPIGKSWRDVVLHLRDAMGDTRWLDDWMVDAFSEPLILAKAPRLWVVAEGVETEERAVRLHPLGCDEAQAYLFSRPLPAEDIATVMPRISRGGGVLAVGEKGPASVPRRRRSNLPKRCM